MMNDTAHCTYRHQYYGVLSLLRSSDLDRTPHQREQQKTPTWIENETIKHIDRPTEPCWNLRVLGAKT
jgi:hypothetical protein